MMADFRDEIRFEAARIENESLHAAERQFAAKTPWIHLNLALGLPSTALAAVAGAAAFSRLSHSDIVAGCISISVAVLTALSTFLDPAKRSNFHAAAGKKYQELYNEARFFSRIELLEDRTDQQLTESLKNLVARLNELNQTSPSTPSRAYRIADQRLRTGDGEVLRDFDAK